MLVLCLCEQSRLEQKRGCKGGLALEVGNDLGGMKSRGKGTGQVHELCLLTQAWSVEDLAGWSGWIWCGRAWVLVTGRVDPIRCLEVGSSAGWSHQARLGHCKWYPGWVWKVREIA